MGTLLSQQMCETNMLASSTDGRDTPAAPKLEDNCTAHIRGSLPFCWATLVSSITLSQRLLCTDTAISEPGSGQKNDSWAVVCDWWEADRQCGNSACVLGWGGGEKRERESEGPVFWRREFCTLTGRKMRSQRRLRGSSEILRYVLRMFWTTKIFMNLMWVLIPILVYFNQFCFLHLVLF